MKSMLLVADNLTVTNPVVASALSQRAPGPIQKLVQRCEKAGAQAIDLNSGPLSKTPEEIFAFLVETVQAVTGLPLVLDTTNPKALQAGLQVCKNKAVINGFSLEPAKMESILPLAKEHQTDIIGYLLHPDSHVAMESDEMMALAVELFEACTSAGLDPQQLIIDPVVVPLSWDNGLLHNRALLTVLRSLTDLLGTPVRSIAGLSNLTSGSHSLESKIALESAYLPMLAAAGLGAAMLNMEHTTVVTTARACNALLEDTVFSW
jgi:5-methyltetrahydrofolate corrinoid/iron sulfur protein methyltransferase